MLARLRAVEGHRRGERLGRFQALLEAVLRVAIARARGPLTVERLAPLRADDVWRASSSSWRSSSREFVFIASGLGEGKGACAKRRTLDAPSASIARLLGARRADRGLHVLALLGRRKHGPHAERLDPELPAPALRVVEVLVLFLLDLLERRVQRLALLAGELLGALAEQLPVEVVLRLGEHDALARDELRRFAGAGRARLLHRLDERRAHAADDLAARGGLLGVDPERFAHVHELLFVLARLVEVLLPFLLEVVVHDALERVLIDLDSAPLVFERLQNQLVQLFLVQCHGVASAC